MTTPGAALDPAVVEGWVAAIDRSQFVLELAPDGTILHANALICAALGYAREELVGRRHRDIILHREEAACDGEHAHRTIFYRAKDGSELIVQATSSPIVGSDGRPERLLLLGIDMTERSALEAALERAEADRRARTTILAAMSREVRTPMSGLLGFAELLMHGELAPDQYRQARMIFDSGRTMLSLIEDLLEVSRMDDAATEVQVEPVDIGDKVRACADLMRPAAEAKGLVLRCEVDPDLPRRSACDALRLRQIVLNLIGNAVRFTPRGWVSVCVEPAWDDRTAVAISVTDTGIGMSRDEARAALGNEDPAGRLAHARPSSAGLGLTISAELARLMGGTLTLASEPGRGTRAELRLPLRPVGATAGGGARAVPLAIAREPRRDAPRVLVVEDHDVNQALALDQLQSMGARADVAADGAEAIDMLAGASRAGDPYRLVLMDLQMPGIDGIEATRRLRALGFSPEVLPIIALTANATTEHVAACLSAGMQGHLAKPTAFDSLRYALDRWAPAGAGSPPVERRRRDRAAARA
ncbi:Aerobic respiration control sensor protein ArcB [Tsuneonella dongtanensis]|uniref:histidine kinase n=1 Tax=Tsuneonella dongtanensis TaxID=692370 RepID=A0A1B2AGL9_9SPHN|nr:response regulator [Tsuneonella dongtanensis]ANY21271.1 Aerobic respiration control sensor protein ArcB [Tsuneonella dongtanensis]